MAAEATPREQTSYQVLMLVDFPDPNDGSITSGWMEVTFSEARRE